MWCISCPLPGCPQPWCCGAESQPTFCLAPACPVLLPFFSGSYLFIYTVNVIKLQQEMEAIPCHSPQASPGPGEQGGALCSLQPPASTEPVPGAEERIECVCEHQDLVPAPAPERGILGKKVHFGGQAGLGVEGLLCWLGMLFGRTWEPAPSTRNFLSPSLGYQGTEVGTEDQLLSSSCSSLQLLPPVGFRVNGCCQGSPGSCPPRRVLQGQMRWLRMGCGSVQVSQ